MTDKEILLKAFEIMIRNYEESDNDLCNPLGCKECPFDNWDVCPNCCNENNDD